jgi:hypothetical protein
MSTFRAQLPVLILCAACSLGTTVRDYPPAHGPAGAAVSIELPNRAMIFGELLAVEPESFLILEGGQMVRVAIRLIRAGKAPKLSFTSATLDDNTRERLRLISRYPQGISAVLEARLLQAYQLTAVREVS